MLSADKSQPLFFHILHQSRVCSAKSHHIPETWLRMGPSVLMGHLQVQKSHKTSAPALPHCQTPPQLLSHYFKEKQHPIHVFPLKSGQELVLDSLELLWPWLCWGSEDKGHSSCVLCQPSHVAQAGQRWLLELIHPCLTLLCPL